ncbi:MAG: class B sortase [Lachnospiraceae bacterium]|nr:class B sortase [Lachnospiraceae bacterium]
MRESIWAFICISRPRRFGKTIASNMQELLAGKGFSDVTFIPLRKEDPALIIELKKNDSAAGSIYLECTNATAFTDRNSLIYGHNMRDKSMFGALQERFLQEGNYLSMPFFYVYLPDGTVNRYFIFSYYETSVGSDTFSTFTEDDAYDYYVYYAKTLTEAKEEASAVLEQAGVADAVTEAGALFAERAPIVTLSTCAGPSGTTKRFVVHGVLYGTAGMTAND